MYMINELILETLDKGKEIGKNEVLKDVSDWLDKNFSDVHVLHDDRVEGNFDNKEQMIQSFKEHFNISE